MGFIDEENEAGREGTDLCQIIDAEPFSGDHGGVVELHCPFNELIELMGGHTGVECGKDDVDFLEKFFEVAPLLC